jgi:hypothetical protein
VVHGPYVEATLQETTPAPPVESVIVGLLRQAAGELARLVESPTNPGDAHHTAAALHAIHRALIELEPLALDPGSTLALGLGAADGSN